MCNIWSIAQCTCNRVMIRIRVSIFSIRVRVRLGLGLGLGLRNWPNAQRVWSNAHRNQSINQSKNFNVLISINKNSESGARIWSAYDQTRSTRSAFDQTRSAFGVTCMQSLSATNLITHVHGNDVVILSVPGTDIWICFRLFSVRGVRGLWLWLGLVLIVSGFGRKITPIW